MTLAGSLSLRLLLALTTMASGLNIPLEVEQPPTIITYTSGPIIVLHFDTAITVKCKARGNPPPEYRWEKDGQAFVPPNFQTIRANQTKGLLVLHSEDMSKFEGKYRCYASNKLGTAMTNEIEIKAFSIPKFPKETLSPIVVTEGEPITLKCNPPEGVAPRLIYWMTVDLQHIEQNERVSMGTDGNLYFSNALKNDSRQDYGCFAAFNRIRTIVQKNAMAVVVKRLKPANDSSESSHTPVAPPARIPSLLLPSGVQTEKVLLKGEDLQLECIPEGFPTPSVKWIKMGEVMSPRVKFNNYNKLLSLSAVEESDEGKYMCTAENSAGKAVHYFDVIVEEPPKWLTEPPQSQLTVIGSDVHIKCSVSGKPQPAITWRRNGVMFRDDPDKRMQVFDDTVILFNAKAEDSGVYQCEASNRHGNILANVNIVIMNMAPLILTENNQEYAAVVGKEITMNCSVFSSPPSSISWTKDEKAIEGEGFLAFESGQSLKIINAEKGDSGKYICVASNMEGSSAVTAVLDVKDATKIVGPPQNTQVDSGKLAKLMCKTEYDASLQDTFELVWRKENKEIPLSSEKNSRYSVKGAMLEIMNVNLSDQGTYTCTARTSLDEDSATAVLTVRDVPDAPIKLDLSELDSPRNVVLSWIPGSDHNSTVTEFVVEYEENRWEPGRWKELQRVTGNQATAELKLYGNLNYQFRVYAVNAIGPGPPSEPTERHKTPPAAPDRNPENIKIQGHHPHQMEISWEPLSPVERNGPGFEYKVKYRQLGVEDSFTEHMVNRSVFLVNNTPTFVPYEIKILSRNSYGWGPEPKPVTGYSGEDVVFWHCLRENVSVPTAAPRDIAVEVINTTVLRVSWTPVPPATVRGRLGGYNVHWVRRRSLLNPDKILDLSHSMSFSGNRSHVIVPGLEPFSEYKLTVYVFNKKGNGPKSDPVTFNTPEGVPEQVTVLTSSIIQRDSVRLEWAQPPKSNGILTSYLLQYHLINETALEVIDSKEINITGADTNHWTLQGLKGDSLYRFDLRACTRAGCGPPQAEESRTDFPEPDLSQTPAVAPAQSSYNCSLSVPSSISGNSTHPPLVPALLNISSYVSDTFAKISWTAREEQRSLQLYVAYMNNRDGNWRISEAVNASQSFHIIDGLEPGTVYTVRLMAKRLLDNASIFEDVIETRTKGAASQESSFSTHGWMIGTMCAVALLTLVVVIACFLRKNKGGKYAVKEKEEPHSDTESQKMNDDTFCDYSDSDEKPLKGGSLCSLKGDDATGDSVSRYTLGDYADGGREFNEDGSFIGEYSGHRHRGSVSEPNGPSLVNV
ncbi:cell adhesion molecule L1-like a isoform X3 [Astatotilapia calliptera]|uniref:cell adhesion molecule L1-like a isoform X3 n=1 Tax=Astatotilapia calliptera TaxID=8154 RepID=UPI000E409156|nr:neural cell adhesion molecule L1-like protein isoform X3 [Astatotilapia calliptera]